MRQVRVIVLVGVTLGLLLTGLGPGTGAGAVVPTGAAGFYAPPSPLAKRPPGTIIRAQPITAPPGAKAWKVLYHSRTVGGDDVAVSGVVVAPTGAAPKGGRTVVTWAHGTTGLADRCAPSKSTAAATTIPFADDLLKAGYVVTATDYEGLGTPGVHLYLVGQSEGRSVLDAARAARDLDATHAGDDVLVAGHSQGGQAALFAGELAESYAPDLKVLGVAAAAPAADVEQMLPLAGTIRGGGGYVVMGIEGFHAAYPDADPASVLTPDALAKADIATTKCGGDVLGAFAGGGVLAHDPLSNPEFQKLLHANSAGNRPAGAPLLIVQGSADATIPQVLTDGFVTKACAAGDTVDYRVYPGATHGSVIDAARADVVAWLTARADDAYRAVDVQLTAWVHTAKLLDAVSHPRRTVIGFAHHVWDRTMHLATDNSIDATPVDAGEIVALRTVLDGSDSAFAVLRAAYRSAQVDGREPHVVELAFDPAVDLEPLLPPDASIVRSVVDEDHDRMLLARGPDYTLLGWTSGRRGYSVSAPTPERARAIADELRRRVPKVDRSGTARVRTWHLGRHGIGNQARSIAAPAWESIEDNYPLRTRTPLSELHRIVRPRRSGKLVLWHGPPGTGKTTALRSLFRSWSPWCDAHYVADPEALFREPEYILKVLMHGTSWNDEDLGATPVDGKEPRFRLIVAEDSDEFLRASARRDAGASLGRLLNVTDGVLGQGFDTLVLLTTNEEIGRLHPALVRPGRCLAAISFSEFASDEAARWLGPGTATPAGPMSLADLFEARGDVDRVCAPATTDRAPGQYL